MVEQVKCSRNRDQQLNACLHCPMSAPTVLPASSCCDERLKYCCPSDSFSRLRLLLWSKNFNALVHAALSLRRVPFHRHKELCFRDLPIATANSLHQVVYVQLHANTFKIGLQLLSLHKIV